MKKTIFLLFTSIVLLSCSNDNEINFTYSYAPIEEVTAPDSFTFGGTDTLKLKYTLANSCYYFNDVYYQYKDSTRIVAIRTIKQLDQVCAQATITEEYDLIVKASQKEDYIFKFWKGTDNNGENIFEEVVVPVN